MGVEAARLALRSAPAAAPEALWFATATPAYLDKTNATAIHAALRLPSTWPPSTSAAPSGRGSAPSGQLGAAGTGTILVVLADMRDGLPTTATSRPGATAPPPCWWATTARCPGGRRVPGWGFGHRRIPGPLADPRRPAVQVVGGAVRRDPLRARSASTPGPRRSRPPGSAAGAGRPGGRHRHARPGRERPSPQTRGGRRGVGRRSVGDGGPDRGRPSRAGPGVDARAGRAGPGGGGGVPGRRGRRPPLPDHRGLAGWRRPTRWPPRSPAAPTSATARSSPGGACSPPNRPAAPSPSGSRPRPPGAARSGSSASSVRGTAPPRPCTCPRPECR